MWVFSSVHVVRIDGYLYKINQIDLLNKLINVQTKYLSNLIFYVIPQVLHCNSKMPFTFVSARFLCLELSQNLEKKI